jgi:TatD DNase family protein
MSESSSFGLIDSHAHIQAAEFADDLPAVVGRARQAGVEKIIVVGGAGDLSSNRAALELTNSFSGLFATVGMHPHDAKNMTELEFEELGQLAQRSGIVAIGETGLDFYYDHSPRRTQIELFCRFIQMARESGFPLVVHVRDAFREAADLLRTHGQREIQGVIHCFTGDMAAAREFLDLGFYLSFSGIITFKNAAPLRDVVRNVPLDRIMIETDSPYLAPVPHRGKRNEPAFVLFVAETIAKIREISLREVTLATSRNVQNLFKI